FGHVLTEQLSTTWAAAEALARRPDLRFLLFTPYPELPDWQRRILAAAGMPHDRVLARPVTAGPVAVQPLVTATPASAVGQYAHPLLRDLYDRTGAALGAQAPVADRPRRVFLTRRSEKRACRNAAEVEARFTEAGFTVVLPETLDIGK